MTAGWTLREEILRLAQRWPWLLLAFLVGSLLGWGLSFVLPPAYTAESELYVAFNADAEFTNPDDYKNWQMGQLDAFILSPDVLHGVVAGLKASGSAWEGLTVQDLQPMLSVRWRNAGRWRLVVTAENAGKASQILQAWHDQVFRQLSDAISHANQFLKTDRELDALSYQLLLAEQRALALQQSKDALLSWREAAVEEQHSGPIETLDRWRLQSVVSRLSGPGSPGQDLLAGMPPAGAEIQAYLPWVDRLLASIDQDLRLQEEWIGVLRARQNELSQRWAEEEQSARGLSAYLHVEPLDNPAGAVQPVRSSAMAALVGGILGLIGLFVLHFARLSLRS